MLFCAGPHASDTTPTPKCRSVVVGLVSLAVIFDDQVHAARDQADREANARGVGVVVHIGECFLGYAEQGALQLEGEAIDIGVETNAYVEFRAAPEACDVLIDGRA